jgi:hypothetical protein
MGRQCFLPTNTQSRKFQSTNLSHADIWNQENQDGFLGRRLCPSKPILPLIPEALPMKDEEKGKSIMFEIKICAGQTAASTQCVQDIVCSSLSGRNPQQSMDCGLMCDEG